MLKIDTLFGVISPSNEIYYSSFALQRFFCIKLFIGDSDIPWEKYKELGYKCKKLKVEIRTIE
jgi:hypothetical protein